jgi:hypothetical protein
MCVDCVLASPRIAQVDPDGEPPSRGGSITALPSKKLITLLPDALSTNKSAKGIGYLSFEVAQLRFLKSTHIRIYPVFFFSTGTMLETKSA